MQMQIAFDVAFSFDTEFATYMNGVLDLKVYEDRNYLKVGFGWGNIMNISNTEADFLGKRKTYLEIHLQPKRRQFLRFCREYKLDKNQ